MGKREKYDGQLVGRLGKSTKMVRGIWYNDGKPYRRWMPAYKQDGKWWGFDTDDSISDVDAVLDMESLDVLAGV